MILSRIEHGQGRKGDLELLENVVSKINMRTLCPLGDAACGLLDSVLRKFRSEFEAHIELGKCPAGESILVRH
jgi:NADH-quinone oxidoreductase subunit F